MTDYNAKTIIAATAVNKQVTTAAGALQILRDIDLQIQRGESVAIVGVSGSGKSTLLGLLAGLDVPSSGRIELAGQLMNELDEDGRAAVRAAQVGFVFQSFHLLPALTALENVMLPLELQGDVAAQAKGEQLLQQVGLAARGQHYPRQLSGGEQQRVAIARAFALSPAILFADEPTGNLDSETAAHVIDILFTLNTSQHTTLVLVTHDEQLAGRCQRRIRLAEGRIQPGEG